LQKPLTTHEFHHKNCTRWSTTCIGQSRKSGPTNLQRRGTNSPNPTSQHWDSKSSILYDSRKSRATRRIHPRIACRRHAVRQGSTRRSHSTSNGGALRLSSKGQWAERAKVVSGRPVWDVRTVNLCSLSFYTLLTNGSDLQAYLIGSEISAYQNHDVGGAFRTVQITRDLQAILGLAIATSIGRAACGVLGMKALGNIWTQHVYPSFNAASWCEQLRSDFLLEWREAARKDEAQKQQDGGKAE
jgi:hypothetical protein